jgi:hypothetical protein
MHALNKSAILFEVSLLFSYNVNEWQRKGIEFVALYSKHIVYRIPDYLFLLLLLDSLLE